MGVEKASCIIGMDVNMHATSCVFLILNESNVYIYSAYFQYGIHLSPHLFMFVYNECHLQVGLLPTLISAQESRPLKKGPHASKLDFLIGCKYYHTEIKMGTYNDQMKAQCI